MIKLTKKELNTINEIRKELKGWTELERKLEELHRTDLASLGNRVIQSINDFIDAYEESPI